MVHVAPEQKVGGRDRQNGACCESASRRSAMIQSSSRLCSSSGSARSAAPKSERRAASAVISSASGTDTTHSPAGHWMFKNLKWADLASKCKLKT